MATYFITGVAGFIGAQVANLLLKEGNQVIGVDNMNDYYDVRLKQWRLESIEKLRGFRFQNLDIENKEQVETLFQKHSFDAVINLAARAGVRYSMQNPDVYFSTNTIGTLNLLKSMKTSGVKKMILASTSSLYAGQQLPFVETLPVNTPISPYAASKKAAEVMAYTYHYLYNIDISIVRYFTVFGPAGRPDMSIFRFIHCIKNGIPLEIYGDGSQSRDFTYIDDIARGTIAAIREVGYEIINLGGGKSPLSIASIIQWIEAILGKKAIVIKKDFHKADIVTTWANIKKAHRMLDWQPEIDVRHGIEKTIQWHCQNEAMLAHIKL